MGEVVVPGEEGGGVLGGNRGSDARVAEGDRAAGPVDVHNGETAEDGAGGVADADAVGTGGSGRDISEVEVRCGRARDRLAVEFPLVGQRRRTGRDHGELAGIPDGDGQVGGLGGDRGRHDHGELGRLADLGSAHVGDADGVGAFIRGLGGRNLEGCRGFAGQVDSIPAPLVGQRGRARGDDGEGGWRALGDGAWGGILGDRGKDDHRDGDGSAGSLTVAVADEDAVVGGGGGGDGRQIQGWAGGTGNKGVIAEPLVGERRHTGDADGKLQVGTGNRGGRRQRLGNLGCDLPGEGERQQAQHLGGKRRRAARSSERDVQDRGEAHGSARGDGGFEASTRGSFPDADLDGCSPAGRDSRNVAGATADEARRAAGGERYRSGNRDQAAGVGTGVELGQVVIPGQQRGAVLGGHRSPGGGIRELNGAARLIDGDDGRGAEDGGEGVRDAGPIGSGRSRADGIQVVGRAGRTRNVDAVALPLVTQGRSAGGTDQKIEGAPDRQVDSDRLGHDDRRAGQGDTERGESGQRTRETRGDTNATGRGELDDAGDAQLATARLSLVERPAAAGLPDTDLEGRRTSGRYGRDEPGAAAPVTRHGSRVERNGGSDGSQRVGGRTGVELGKVGVAAERRDAVDVKDLLPQGRVGEGHRTARSLDIKDRRAAGDGCPGVGLDDDAVGSGIAERDRGEGDRGLGPARDGEAVEPPLVAQGVSGGGDADGHIVSRHREGREGGLGHDDGRLSKGLAQGKDDQHQERQELAGLEFIHARVGSACEGFWQQDETEKR